MLVSLNSTRILIRNSRSNLVSISTKDRKSELSFFFFFLIWTCKLEIGLEAAYLGMFALLASERFFLFCLLVFTAAVPCSCDEDRVDEKVLYAGKELWGETLSLQSGSRVYKLEGLKSYAWYEVKISYPASIPASFSLQLLQHGDRGLKLNRLRRLLNTEKLIFETESLDKVQNKGGLYVLVTVEPEGIVAIPNLQERPFIIYNIVCEELLLGIPYSSWSVVTLVLLCLVVASIIPRFLPWYLLRKNQVAQSANHNLGKNS